MNNLYNNRHLIEVENVNKSIASIFSHIKNINFTNNKTNRTNKTNKTKLCFNFIKGKRCKWYERGTCRFAHCIEELNLTSISKILELGTQAYYYICEEQKENRIFLSIFDLVNIYKNTELLFKKEHYNLYKSRVQYDELHKYVFKLKKELELQNNISSLYLSDHINDLINSDCLGNSTIQKMNELKNLINSTIGCKICYKNIIELNNEDNREITNNYNFITLSCGHSICEHCHIELINKKTNIYIECPLCRNINNINKTIPNYELNEQILKIKLIFSKLNEIHNNIKDNYKQLNNNNFKNKNIKNGYISYKNNKNITLVKSFEAPW